MTTFSFESIGTKWQIDIHSEVSAKTHTQLKKNVFLFLQTFDKVYSRFGKDTLVTKISQSIGVYRLPKSSKEIFEIYKKLYELTNGKFTPLIGDTLALAGYDDQYSLNPKEVKEPMTWNDAMSFNYPYLKTNEKVILDFGACGKGYAIDEIARLLIKAGIESFIIDAGGDLYVNNVDEARVGLENPFEPKEIIGVANVNNESICASALNRRTWGQYSHIINPKTLTSPTDVVAVWTISKKAVVADALSTAVFLENPEKLTKDFRFEYLILKSDFSILKSKNFPAKIYYNN